MFLASFSFANKWWLLAIPFVLLLGLLSGKVGFSKTITFSSLSILGSLGRKSRRKAGGYRISFLLLALLCGVIALARPQWSKTYETSSNNGIDIVIALDLSYSMIIDDFYPNDDRSKRAIMRLEAAKGVLKTFIDQRSRDRLGIVAFSGRPYSLCPITTHHAWLHKRLKEVKIGDIVEQGTAIGSAIAASSTRLTDREAPSKVIILITDGANNTGSIDPVESAKLAAQLGIKVYTIAIGTEEGRVPLNIQRFPKQEFDLPTLKEIASSTGGEFFRAKSVSDLRYTFDSINDLEKTEVKVRNTVKATELFPWLTGLSTLFLILSMAYRLLVPTAAL